MLFRSIGEFHGIKDKSINYHLLGYNPGYVLLKGTKGCPNNCSYCAVHKLEGHKFCFRNPDEVFKEIEQEYEKHNITEVGIWDSNLLINYKNYFGAILEKVKKKRLNLSFSAPEGLDYRLINQKIANDLKKAGFGEISIALENYDFSVSKKQLNRANNIQSFKKTITFLKKAGFKGKDIRVFIMTALPNQKFKNVIDNIKFVWSFGCNVTIFPFTPIPGTEIYKENYDFLKNKKFKDLHPLLHIFVNDKKELNNFIEIIKLNLVSKQKKLQSKHFKEILVSENLIKALDHIPPPPLP